MRDPVSGTLIAFVFTQVLFTLLLPLVLIPPPEGLEWNLYVITLETARELVVEAAAVTVVLFTAAIWIQRRFWMTGFFAAVPLVGLSLVLGPFWYNTGGFSPSDAAGKKPLFFAGYLLLALILGAIFWFMAGIERRDWGPYERE
jgi:hypothetical protein